MPLIRADDLYEEDHGIQFDLWNDLPALVYAVFIREGHERNDGKQVMMTHCFDRRCAYH